MLFEGKQLLRQGLARLVEVFEDRFESFRVTASTPTNAPLIFALRRASLFGVNNATMGA